MTRFALAVVLILTAVRAVAQDWGDLDALILPNLTSSGSAEASFWLPDAADPATASIALAVVYEYIQGSAGSTSIAAGFFVKQEGAWVFAGPVQGLFGQSPRDVAYGETAVNLTTIMLGPNEPRCCPTLPVRWRIDYQTLTATRLD
jgi:hypothetical protein